MTFSKQPSPPRGEGMFGIHFVWDLFYSFVSLRLARLIVKLFNKGVLRGYNFRFSPLAGEALS